VHAAACASSWYHTCCFPCPQGVARLPDVALYCSALRICLFCGCSARVRGGRHHRGATLPVFFMPAASFPGYHPAFPPSTSPAGPSPQPSPPAAVATPGRGRGVALERHHGHARTSASTLANRPHLRAGAAAAPSPPRRRVCHARNHHHSAPPTAALREVRTIPTTPAARTASVPPGDRVRHRRGASPAA